MTAAFPVSTPTDFPRHRQGGSEEAPRCPPGPRGPHLCGETALTGCGAAPSRRPSPQLGALRARVASGAERLDLSEDLHLRPRDVTASLCDRSQVPFPLGWLSWSLDAFLPEVAEAGRCPSPWLRAGLGCQWPHPTADKWAGKWPGQRRLSSWRAGRVGCPFEAGPAALLTLMWTGPKESPSQPGAWSKEPILDPPSHFQSPCYWSVKSWVLLLGSELVGKSSLLFCRLQVRPQGDGTPWLPGRAPGGCPCGWSCCTPPSCR